LSGNNFYQERGTDAEIQQFLADHNVKFPVMSKVDCSNSDTAHPIFPFLFRKLPSTGLLSYILGSGLKWNFTKFLLNKDGVPVKRFEPTVQPRQMEQDILALLKEK
jgi:glutathione peroxidase